MVRLASQPYQEPAGIQQRLVLACLCVCAQLGGCAELPGRPAAAPRLFLPSASSRSPLAIGVLVAGWHSGIVLPEAALPPLLSALQGSNTKYLSIGWGNRRFYMATRPGPGDAVAALFRSPSVLFVQAVSTPTELVTSDTRIDWICVSRDELWRADSYIEASLSRPHGKLIALGRGALPGSRFYGSTGHYSAIHTCNTWTLAALQYAGLPVRAGGVIFAGQVDKRIAPLHACPPP